MYEYEMWELKDTNEQVLKGSERKAMRKIHDPTNKSRWKVFE